MTSTQWIWDEAMRETQLYDQTNPPTPPPFLNPPKPEGKWHKNRQTILPTECIQAGHVTRNKLHKSKGFCKVPSASYAYEEKYSAALKKQIGSISITNFTKWNTWILLVRGIFVRVRRSHRILIQSGDEDQTKELLAWTPVHWRQSYPFRIKYVWRFQLLTACKKKRVWRRSANFMSSWRFDI